MSNNNNVSTGAGSAGIGFAGLLTVALIVLKLTHFIGWSWWWVWSPIWIEALIILGVVLMVCIIACVAWLVD